MQLSDQQIVHRQYLCSPIWKQKREEALTFYGCICNRCQEFGNDVHHKTYERVGGSELMEDLEIVCRDCHEAHHRVEKVQVKDSKPKGIHRRAIYQYLKKKQRLVLLERFDIPTMPKLFMEIAYNSTQVALTAATMLGFDYYFNSFHQECLRLEEETRLADPARATLTLPPLASISLLQLRMVPTEIIIAAVNEPARIVEIQTYVNPPPKRFIREIDYYEKHFPSDPYQAKWPVWIRLTQ